MSVLAKGDDFEGGLTVYVDCVTEDLGALLSILSPPAPDNSRREKGLRDIVEKAVKLTIEVSCAFLERLDSSHRRVLTICTRSINSRI